MGTLLVITGASGSGKTTVAQMLKEDFQIDEIVSTTTRPKREHEIDGVSYYFVREDQFHLEAMMEWTKYGDYYYGTSIREVEKALKKDGFTCAVLEKNGADYYKKTLKEKCIRIYIDSPPQLALQRLRHRMDEASQIQKRIQQYKQDEQMKKDADIVLNNQGSLHQLRKHLHEMMKGLSQTESY